MTVLSSTYPPAPMDYANQFTGENLKNGKVLQPPKLIKVIKIFVDVNLNKKKG